MATRLQSGLARTTTPRLPARYVPVRPLAHGATATVWCAEDRRLGRRVAVKLLAEPYASDPEAVRRFTREARAVARLSTHPHVVTIFDVGTTVPEPPGQRGCPFLVMAHVTGGTVADALRLGAYDAADALRWVHQAAQALDFAHAHGIVHRDVKPANLLLDSQRDLHVADFGIAQTAGQQTLTRHQQVLGTASYLPPERALGQPATVASDLYSLAVVAFELLAGERPFTGQSLVELARQHLDAERPRASERNPELPRAVDPVLARGLARDPADRWPSATAFATALGRALGPGSAPALAPAPVPAQASASWRDQEGPRARPLRRPGRRAPVAALLVALLAVVILAAGAASGGSAPGAGPARAAGALHPARSLGTAERATASLLRTSDMTPGTSASAAPASSTIASAPAPVRPAAPPAPPVPPEAAFPPRHGHGPGGWRHHGGLRPGPADGAGPRRGPKWRSRPGPGDR
jgi:hypothetical protein